MDIIDVAMLDDEYKRTGDSKEVESAIEQGKIPPAPTEDAGLINVANVVSHVTNEKSSSYQLDFAYLRRMLPKI
jgi:hypothetical protein